MISLERSLESERRGPRPSSATIVHCVQVFAGYETRKMRLLDAHCTMDCSRSSTLRYSHTVMSPSTITPSRIAWCMTHPRPVERVR